MEWGTKRLEGIESVAPPGPSPAQLLLQVTWVSQPSLSLGGSCSQEACGGFWGGFPAGDQLLLMVLNGSERSVIYQMSAGAGVPGSLRHKAATPHP